MIEFHHEHQLIANGATKDLKKKRQDILLLLKHGIASVDPYFVMGKQFQESFLTIGTHRIDLHDFQKIFVAAFGKASIGMMNAVLDHCTIEKGVVITNEAEISISHPDVTTFHGGHPIPTQESIIGTKAIEEMICQISGRDLLLVLISGGGSALLCHPRVSLEDMQKTTSILLKCGASIQEINTIRKHLSHVKGGQLVRNVKGRVISYVISDVIGDPLGFIASGPTVGDETSFQQAKQIIHQYDIWNTIPSSVQNVISQGMNKDIPETPFDKDIDKNQITTKVIANNTRVCETIVHHAKQLGYKPLLLSTSLQGEARKVGKNLIDTFHEKNLEKDITLLVAGGETTVTVKGNGRGGRNQEMVLSVLKDLKKHGIIFASCGTDGIDGMSTAAGAIADPNSYDRAVTNNLNIDTYLENNNSNEFFQKIHDLLITGPTGTNVMDIQLILKV